MSNILPFKSCGCTRALLQKANAHKWSVPGLACVLLPDGSEAAGVLSAETSRIVGEQPKRRLLAFRYCPWCGSELDVSGPDPVEPGKEN
jgi:hypothetical protein